MSEYNHNKIEKKWQNYWHNNQINKVHLDSTENKKYVLTMFSYRFPKKNFQLPKQLLELQQLLKMVNL